MKFKHAVPALLAMAASSAIAATVSVQVPAPTSTGLVKQVPAGHSEKQGDIGWDAASFVRNGKAWVPVMGEFHYSRYPAAEWREELLKMKAGGITMISTYVFWIHHEEEQGKFTWDGDKNLRKFVETCAEVGLPVIVRVGPWCHGEVRNGGFPDWVQALPGKRSNNAGYLAAVKPYYDQIGLQLKGLYWKDNGPIIGIQFENEFKGAAAHLVTLKQMGLAAGMDVPIYTRTAWDNATNVPTFGEVMPLWGGYAEGFWDRTLDSMPGNYWQVFQFMRDRAPGNAMGSDPNAVAQAAERGEVLAYPYLTCELGGGMMSSYHRRIDIAPMDVYAVALTKVGSGSNMPGYYMYHGGTNPEGKLSYLMEMQTPPQNMWNDMPAKNYDFGACLGAAGEVRESYHLARRFHLFLNDFGEQLARMPATLGTPARNKQDSATLRWAVRSNGRSGFLFVNNYQRAQEMPAKPDTQFDIKLPDGNSIKIPAEGGVTVPANSCFIWPINLDLGGVGLSYATAMPVCRYRDPAAPMGQNTYVFTSVGGVPAEFVFDKGVTVTMPAQNRLDADGRTHVIVKSNPDISPEIIIAKNASGQTQIIEMFSDADSRGLYKGTIDGHDQVVTSRNWTVIMDGSRFILSGTPSADDAIKFRPALHTMQPQLIGGAERLQASGTNTGAVAVIPIFAPGSPKTATMTVVKPAGSLRNITMGSQKVAAEPTDADFDSAAQWNIKLPAVDGKILLRLHYTGDVARIYLGDKFILDDFYNGKPLDLALWRYSKEELSKGLTVKILPLQKGAPIFFAKWPEFDGPSVAKIDSVELVEERQITLQAK